MHWKHTLTVFAAGMASAFLVYHAVNLTASAQNEQASKHTADKTVSYALGWEMGKEAMLNLGFDGVAVDAAQMTAGFGAAIGGHESSFESHQMNLALIEFNDVIFDRMHDDRLRNDPVYRALAQANATEGSAARARFAAMPNVQSLDTGALYRVDKSGDGASPTLGDFIVLNYRMLTLEGLEVGEGDGEVVDTRTMLKAGQELIQLMKVGDKWVIFLSPQGEDGRASRIANIGPNEALIIEIELLGITDQPDE